MHLFDLALEVILRLISVWNLMKYHQKLLAFDLSVQKEI